MEQLLAALKECERVDSIYPDHLPYQMLTSHLLVKSDGYRKTILEIWKAMPDALNDQGLKLINSDEQSQFEFLNVSISKKQALADLGNFQKSLSASSSSQNANKLIDPDSILPSLDKSVITDKDETPLFNQSVKNTRYKISGTGPEIESSDCCEAAFLSFLLDFFGINSLSLHSLGTKSPDFLRTPYDVSPYERELKEELINFLNKKEILDPKNQSLRNQWKELTSNREGLDYFGEIEETGRNWRYDLRPSVDNFIELINTFTSDLKLGKNQSRTEKLIKICKVFGCHVQMIPAEEPPLGTIWNDVTLQFSNRSVPGGKDLEIKIMPNHCVASHTKKIYAPKAAEIIKAVRQGAFSEIRPNQIVVLNEGKGIYSPFEDSFHVLARAFKESGNVSPYNQLVSTIVKGDTDSFSKQKVLFPLLNCFEIESSEDAWTYINAIFDNKLRGYYPRAIRLLGILPLDSYQVWQISSLLVKLRGYDFPNDVGKKLRGDLEKIARKTMSNPKFNQIAATMARTRQEQVVASWIRSMSREYSKDSNLDNKK